MNNNTIFVILLLASTFLTSTLTMLPAAHARGGDNDDDDKRGDGNKQKVEEEGAGAIADCDWNNIEESDFLCIARAGEIIRDGGTTPPPVPFTVSGEGSEGSVVCDPPAPDVEAFIRFAAQRDGTVSGTYTFSAPDANNFIREGVITEGTTDGNTYTFSGENLSVCSSGGPSTVGETTISGFCGDDVTITYEDPFTVATFTGNVDCDALE
jgi:hypothetical protein